MSGPSLFGGSWLSGDDAGSRCAGLDYWPDFSADIISARGRCDHLTAPARPPRTWTTCEVIFIAALAAASVIALWIGLS